MADWRVLNLRDDGLLLINKKTEERRRFQNTLCQGLGGFYLFTEITPRDKIADSSAKDEPTKKLYLMNEKGEYFRDLCECELSFKGYAKIKRAPESGWQVIDTNFNLSEEFYQIWLDYINRAENGIVLVQKDKNSGLQFKNKTGELSEEFYRAKGAFVNGFNMIKKTPVSDWCYIDENFNTSEEFAEADHYYYGMAAVRKTPNSYWQFRDTQGNLSEVFLQVERYHEGGFAKVRPTKGKVKWRDLLGNLSERQTQLGKDYFKYVNRKATIYDLSDECFGNDAFLQRILAQEQFDLNYYCSLCQTQEDLNKLYESASDISDYVKGKAYEAYVKAEEEAKRQSQTVPSQKQEETEAVSEDKRQEMMEKIGKIF